MSHAITVEIEVDDELLADIMCTALEGGIGYWCAADNIQRAESGEGWSYQSFNAYDAEDGKPFDTDIVSLATIGDGINALLKPGAAVREDIRAAVFNGVINNDAGNIDAEAADCIVQFGMFGEIVYG